MSKRMYLIFITAILMIIEFSQAQQILNDFDSDSFEKPRQLQSWTSNLFRGCPKIKSITNFDLDKYLGTWFEMYRRKNIRFQTGECVQANYSIRDDGFIKVLNSQQKYAQQPSNKSFEPRSYGEAWGKKKYQNSLLGELQIRTSIFWPFSGSYNIISTDYQTYTIVYSCTSPLSLYKTEYAWVLTRQPMDQNLNQTEFNRITQIGISVLNDQIKNFDFYDQMRYTIQGEQNQCEYMK